MKKEMKIIVAMLATFGLLGIATAGALVTFHDLFGFESSIPNRFTMHVSSEALWVLVGGVVLLLVSIIMVAYNFGKKEGTKYSNFDALQMMKRHLENIIAKIDFALPLTHMTELGTPTVFDEKPEVSVYHSLLTAFSKIKGDLNTILENSISSQTENANRAGDMEIQQRIERINKNIYDMRVYAFDASVEAAKFGEQGKTISLACEEISKIASLCMRSCEDSGLFIERIKSDRHAAFSRSKDNIAHAATRCTEIIKSCQSLIEDIPSAFAAREGKPGDTVSDLRDNDLLRIRRELHELINLLTNPKEFLLTTPPNQSVNSSSSENDHPRIVPIQEIADSHQLKDEVKDLQIKQPIRILKDVDKQGSTRSQTPNNKRKSA